MKRNSLAVCLLLALAGCDASPERAHWHVAGQLNDGLQAKFVEIDGMKAQDRATYDDAVSTLCRNQQICVIGFFLAGDRLPNTENSRQFFASGGWEPYAPLAIWWSNSTTGKTGFTKWDCQRAGEAAAPLDALCGEGIDEAHSALLSLASRVGIGEACKWPATDGAAVAAAYLASLPDVKRREHFQSAYDQMYTSSRSGPDQLSSCARIRGKLDADAKKARQTLKR